MSELFIKASRKKFRFPSSKGDLTIEQLWDLPLTSTNGCNLDAIARSVFNSLKEIGESSFIETRPHPMKAELEDKLEILKFIIATKMAEAAAAETRRARAEEKRQVLEALAARKAANLATASEEDLLKKLEALSD